MEIILLKMELRSMLLIYREQMKSMIKLQNVSIVKELD